MRHIYWRKDWGARKPRATTYQGPPREAFIHHDDYDPRPYNHLEEQIAHMRQLQNLHMDERGWSDIGYHWVVFQAYGNIPGPRAFCGRASWHVPAAQLGHNTGTLAICVVGQEITLQPETRKLIIKLLNRYKKIQTLGGHRDVTPTSCPGNSLYSQVPSLAKAAGLKVYR